MNQALSAETHPLQKTAALMALATVCTLLWGSSIPILKACFVSLRITTLGGIYDFIAYRFLIAGIVTGVFIAARGDRLALRGMRQYGAVVLVALVQVCLQFVFFYYGLMHTSGVKASVINGTGPLFTILLSWIFIASERMNAKKWTGSLLGFAGLVAVNVNTDLLSLSFSMAGEGMLLVTAVTGAFGSLLVKRISRDITALHINLYQFMIGSLMLLAVSAVSGDGHLAPVDLAPADLIMLLYLGVSSAVAFTLWYLLISFNNLSRVSVYYFMVPLWGALFSAVFLPGETVNSMSALGALLVSAGIYLVVKNGK